MRLLILSTDRPWPFFPRRQLEPWIDRLALRRQHPEHALVHAPQRLARHEALQSLETEGRLAHRQASLATHAALPEEIERSPRPFTPRSSRGA